MIISLIICTYNRADILKITLPCYENLLIPDDVFFEVIVIDNNSDDETAETVKKHIKKSRPDIRYNYYFEPEQGLSHARNRGFKHASGDYIAYTDDECILPSEWLEVAIKHIKADRPAFLGGPYYGKFLPGSSSSWYKESFGNSYILQYNVPDGPMTQRFLAGGNMVIRRDVFDKVGLFDKSLGMNGETIDFGEEQDIQKRLRNQFPNEVILYDSKLFVWHFIRDEKISLSYLFYDALIRGVSSAKAANNSFLRLLISPLMLLYYLIRALFLAAWRFTTSLFSKDHFFTLLHHDYKSNVWRSIGGSWYRSKLLLSRLLPFSKVKTVKND